MEMIITYISHIFQFYVRLCIHRWSFSHHLDKVAICRCASPFIVKCKLLHWVCHPKQSEHWYAKKHIYAVSLCTICRKATSFRGMASSDWQVLLTISTKVLAKRIYCCLAAMMSTGDTKIFLFLSQPNLDCFQLLQVCNEPLDSLDLLDSSWSEKEGSISWPHLKGSLKLNSQSVFKCSLWVKPQLLLHWVSCSIKIMNLGRPYNRFYPLIATCNLLVS